jgi:hypothetical protein
MVVMTSGHTKQNDVASGDLGTLNFQLLLLFLILPDKGGYFFMISNKERDNLFNKPPLSSGLHPHSPIFKM